MISIFDPKSHPVICEFLIKGRGNGVYLEEITSWPHDIHNPNFADVLEENLGLTKDLFIDDQIFCNHLTSDNEKLVWSRLSEIWLAAHLLRYSFPLERVPEGKLHKQTTPDFRLVLKIGDNSRPVNIEVKRMSSYKYEGDKADLMSIGSPHKVLDDSNFNRKLSNTLKKAMDQLAYTSPNDNQSPLRMLAWDVTYSSDVQQLLLHESDTQVTQWIRSQLSKETRAKSDVGFFYVIEKQKAELFFFRIFSLVEIQ